MQPPHLVRLRDILQAMDEVAEIITDLDLEAFQADVRSRRAVERCIEIVSEATRHIPASEKDRFPEVPWSDIAGIGNISVMSTNVLPHLSSGRPHHALCRRSGR